MKEISEGALNGPAISAEPGDFGSLQPLIQKPDCLDETRVVIKPVATGAAGGQPAKSKHTEDKHFFFLTRSVLRNQHFAQNI